MKYQILLILTIVLLSACSLVNEPYQSCPDDERGETITLIFKMTNSGSATRTDDLHEEEDSEFRQLEDGIDFGDLGLFVFAGLSSGTDDEENYEQKLLLKNTDITSTTTQDLQINGIPGAYTVHMEIPIRRLNNFLLEAKSEEGASIIENKQIIFRVLIVANGSAGEEMWAKITGTTYKDVIDQLSDWVYDMENLYNNSYNNNDIAGLYTNTNKYIPMFGTNHFLTSQKTLNDSPQGNQILLGDIDLLRALAKVMVVDNIQNKDESGYPKVVKAEFISSRSKALQLPSGALTYENGKQVDTANIYHPDNSDNLADHAIYQLGIIPDDATPSDRKGLVFGGFVPEQEIGYTNNDSGEMGLPEIKITIALSDGQDQVYVVPMKGYNGEQFSFGNSILRNHVYTLSVDKVKSELEINIAVKEWRKIKFEYEY